MSSPDLALIREFKRREEEAKASSALRSQFDSVRESTDQRRREMADMKATLLRQLQTGGGLDTALARTRRSVKTIQQLLEQETLRIDGLDVSGRGVLSAELVSNFKATRKDCIHNVQQLLRLSDESERHLAQFEQFVSFLSLPVVVAGSES